MASATLLGAVNEAWNASPALAAALTLYNDEPPEGTALPYAVVTDVSESKERSNFEGGNHWHGTAELVFYGLGTATVEALAAQAAAALEATPPAVTNRETLETILEVYSVRIDLTRSTDARRVTEARGQLTVWTHG